MSELDPKRAPCIALAGALECPTPIDIEIVEPITDWLAAEDVVAGAKKWLKPESMIDRQVAKPSHAGVVVAAGELPCRLAIAY
jgi:hypothetical protein